MDDYTPDAWHDLLGDLELADCRAAVAAITRRQPFVAPAEIRDEVRRIREDRLARQLVPAPPADLTDDPARYRAALEENVQRIADGWQLPPAIGPAGSGTAPTREYLEARRGLGHDQRSREERLRDLALRQVAESRAAYERMNPDSGRTDGADNSP